jgi:hypothetical protein
MRAWILRHTHSRRVAMHAPKVLYIPYPLANDIDAIEVGTYSTFVTQLREAINSPHSPELIATFPPRDVNACGSAQVHSAAFNKTRVLGRHTR